MIIYFFQFRKRIAWIRNFTTQSRDPLSYQRSLESYDVLENTLKSKSHLWMMPH